MPSLIPLSLCCLAPEQLAAAVELDRKCLGGLWSEAGYRREMESPNSDLLLLCTGVRPIAIGCVWAILEEGHITLLGVDPEFRRQGLGQLLLCFLLRGAYKRGLEWATLEVRASNQAALSLYNRLGFQSVGERRGYYPDGENALILWNKGLRDQNYLTQLEGHYRHCRKRLHGSHWSLENILSTQEFLALSRKS